MSVESTSNSSWEDEPSELPVAIGDVLDGKYRIVRVLGKGGMGVVMAAVHVQLGHRIALKFLTRAGAHNEEALARFALEAKAAALMRSEHATRILDIGRLARGEPYMVLEMLEGADLGALVMRRGPMPMTNAVTYVLEACEALAEAHALGIVHRDLKPDNLFLATRPDGTQIIKVLDFGISKFSSRLDDKLGKVPPLTTTTAILGSPVYMSPEQLKSTRDVDHRTDIWSIGIVLYELIAGQPPFPWRNMAELSAAILKDKPEPLGAVVPSIPPEFERVIARCLEKNPSDRYDNIAELAWALVPFGGPTAIHSAERASELLAQASNPAALQDTSIDERDKRADIQTRNASSDPISLRFVALPANTTDLAEETAATKELRTLRRSWISPALKTSSVGIVCVLLVLAFLANRYLGNAMGTSGDIVPARRGIAHALSLTPTPVVSTPDKLDPAPEAEVKKAPLQGTSANVSEAKPKASAVGRRKPPRVQTSPAPRQTEPNPYADRE